MERPLISIIIPIFNVEKYLKDCISSVVNQTYTKTEIILIDDGSTDLSPIICDDIAKGDKRICVIHKKNGGLSDARNFGIEICKGEYITFIDSDDMVALNYIETLYEAISSDGGCDLAVAQKNYMTESGLLKIKGNKHHISFINGKIKCMTEFLTKETIGTTAWGKLYKRNLFAKIRYPYGKYHEDVYTTYKIIAQSNKIAICDDTIYYYRLREGSIMNQQFQAKHLDAIAGKKEQASFIRIYYPSLIHFAESDVIYAANCCLSKISKSLTIYDDYVEIIKQQYKEYGLRAALRQHSLSGKLFAVAAFLNIHLLLKGLRCINKIQNYVQ